MMLKTENWYSDKKALSASYDIPEILRDVNIQLESLDEQNINRPKGISPKYWINMDTTLPDPQRSSHPSQWGPSGQGTDTGRRINPGYLIQWGPSGQEMTLDAVSTRGIWYSEDHQVRRWHWAPYQPEVFDTVRTIRSGDDTGRRINPEYLIQWGPSGQDTDTGCRINPGYLIQWGPSGQETDTGRRINPGYLIQWGPSGQEMTLGAVSTRGIWYSEDHQVRRWHWAPYQPGVFDTVRTSRSGDDTGRRINPGYLIQWGPSGQETDTGRRINLGYLIQWGPAGQEMTLGAVSTRGIWYSEDHQVRRWHWTRINPGYLIQWGPSGQEMTLDAYQPWVFDTVRTSRSGDRHWTPYQPGVFDTVRTIRSGDDTGRRINPGYLIQWGPSGQEMTLGAVSTRGIWYSEDHQVRRPTLGAVSTRGIWYSGDHQVRRPTLETVSTRGIWYSEDHQVRRPTLDAISTLGIWYSGDHQVRRWHWTPYQPGVFDTVRTIRSGDDTGRRINPGYLIQWGPSGQETDTGRRINPGYLIQWGPSGQETDTGRRINPGYLIQWGPSGQEMTLDAVSTRGIWYREDQQVRTLTLGAVSTRGIWYSEDHQVRRPTLAAVSTRGIWYSEDHQVRRPTLDTVSTWGIWYSEDHQVRRWHWTPYQPWVFDTVRTIRSGDRHCTPYQPGVFDTVRTIRSGDDTGRRINPGYLIQWGPSGQEMTLGAVSTRGIWYSEDHQVRRWHWAPYQPGVFDTVRTIRSGDDTGRRINPGYLIQWGPSGQEMTLGAVSTRGIWYSGDHQVRRWHWTPYQPGVFDTVRTIRSGDDTGRRINPGYLIQWGPSGQETNTGRRINPGYLIQWGPSGQETDTGRRINPGYLIQWGPSGQETNTGCRINPGYLIQWGPSGQGTDTGRRINPGYLIQWGPSGQETDTGRRINPGYLIQWGPSGQEMTLDAVSTRGIWYSEDHQVRRWHWTPYCCHFIPGRWLCFPWISCGLVFTRTCQTFSTCIGLKAGGGVLKQWLPW